MFSADGTQLAYLKEDLASYGRLVLHIAAADGSADRAIVMDESFGDLYAPRFSPAGTQIVFAAVGGPETDDTGTPLKPGAQTPLQSLVALFSSATVEAHGMAWDLWSIHTDGSGLRRLTSLLADMPMAAFSPNGNEIVMLAAGGIYRMDADGQHLRRIDLQGNHGGVVWMQPGS